MLLFSFALLLVFVPHVVLSTIQFQISQVRQCEPVSITLTGDPNMDPIPMTLTLIPFDYHLISVHLPNATANISGVYVSFFPFPQGTSFVATLDDVKKTSAGMPVVSDIIHVLPSPTGNTTCLSQAPRSPNIYTINSTISQCQEFNVTYNKSVVSQGPSIRLFNPLGPSFLLNQTADNRDEGTATYLMDFNQGEEVVLLFDGGADNRKTSPLTIIGGNSLSSDKCLNNRFSPGSGGSTHLALIVGITVGGTIFLLFLGTILFILRRRQQRNRHLPFDRTALIEKSGVISHRPPSPPSKEYFTASHHSRYDSDIPRIVHQGLPAEQRLLVTNPLYTAEDFPYSPKDSMISWAQPGEALASPKGRASASLNRRTSQDRLTLNSLDIEHMLNMATVQSSNSSTITVDIPAPVCAQPSSTNIRSHSSPSGANFTQLKPYPGRVRLPVPSDISTYSYSFTHSLHHTDPSADSNVTGLAQTSRSIVHTSELNSTIRRPPDAVVALPSSPGHGQSGSMTQFGLPGIRDGLGDRYGS